ncbi:glycosyltransferase family 4 protein [Winogradskyella forsetii]|uniref:glycosyltransferase family 4 protein n=1 Tax=Winogradskyella forsetii TaxID=2686077 RepID=UPI0015BC8D3A|nr:glycosyltransferase family 4 protein [Winogradskyella forsetii]
MKSKKVLYIGNNLFNKTGYPTTLQTLSELLRKEGFTVVKASNKLNLIIRMLHMIYVILKHQKTTDVVLIDTYSTLNFYYAYLCSKSLRFFNKPYIPILHGGSLPERLKKSPKLSRSIFKNAYINVAPSQYLTEIFKNSGFNTICISNTLEIESYKFKNRKKIQPKLLYVRSFAEIYNPKMAVKVLFELKRNYPDAILCMVGPDRDGSLKSVKELVKVLNLEKNIEFTGVLAKDVWHKKSEEYDVFINTSNVDNMPVSIIEAMALGLPVVSTNVGGIKHLVNDKISGFLVNPDDEIAMVNAIKELIENGSENVTLTARATVEGFKWDIIKHKWNELLNGI